jgi:hypothetical protein
VVHSAAGIGVGAAVTSDVDSVANGAVTQEETPTNNTTVQQENPEEVNEAGDTDALRAYLSQKLAQRLAASSLEISQGEYEQGRSVLGDEYNDLLGKYVDVEGETEGSSTGDSFNQAAEQQRDYSDSVGEYNETYQEYEEAKAAGNTARARELARQLDRLQREINRSDASLQRSYQDVENSTGQDLSAAARNIENTTRQVSELHQTVITETFVRTNLTLTTTATTVSFDEPATIRGQLELANGTALANETVDIRVGERVRTVQTDGDGTFTIEYQPVTAPAGTMTVGVVYEPAVDSVYLGSNARLELSITQTTANVTIADAPDSAKFGDDISATGRAHVNGTPVPGVRVRVRLGGVVLGTVTTESDGTYQLSGTMPATVQAGEQSIQATIVPDDQAVRSETTTAPIRIGRTSTNLDVNAEQTNDGIRISGQLTTADGDGVAGRPVELRLANSTVAIVDTGANGEFSRTVTPAAGLSETVSVHAVYDEPSSNLDSTTASTEVGLTSGTNGENGNANGQAPMSELSDLLGWSNNGQENEQGWSPLSLEILGGGGIFIISLAAIVWLVRRGDTEETTTPAPPTASSTTSEPGTGPVEESAVTEASSLLAAGDSDAAVRTLYMAVRQSIEAGTQRGTHWEFYTTASDTLSPESAGTLERLTQAYERVAYSPDHIDAETADSLLEEVTGLLEDADDEV